MNDILGLVFVVASWRTKRRDGTGKAKRKRFFWFQARSKNKIAFVIGAGREKTKPGYRTSSFKTMGNHPILPPLLTLQTSLDGHLCEVAVQLACVLACERR